MANENPTDQPTEAPGDDAPIDHVRAWGNRERERREAAEARAADADALRRELAFAKAGVPDETPLGKLFMTGYSGELDTEAVKAAWAEVAPTPVDPPAGDPTPPPPTDPATGLTEEQQEQLRQSREGLNSDAVPPGSEPTTPLGQGIMNAAFEAQGGARARPPQGMGDKALNAGFSHLFERAAKGDPAAVFKRPDEHIADATERWRQSQS